MRKITGPLFEGVLRDDGAIDLVDGYMTPREEHNACLLSEAFATLADATRRAHFFPGADCSALCGAEPGLDREAGEHVPRCPVCSLMASVLQSGSEN